MSGYIKGLLTLTLACVAAPYAAQERHQADADVMTSKAPTEVVLPSGYTRVTLPLFTPRTESYAVGINDNGLIAGAVWEPRNFPVIWRQKGKPHPVDRTRTNSAAARAISNCGSVTGSTSLESMSRAWLIQQNKLMWIGPSDESSSGVDVNCSDQVVGTWQRRGFASTRSFYWSTATGLVDIGVDESIPWAINESGQVVGRFRGGTASGASAFLWDSANGVTDLSPALNCTDAGGICSAAWDINDVAQVVGEYRKDGVAVSHPFIWSATDGKFDIPVNGPALTINNNGMVAGLDGSVSGTAIWVWTAAEGVRYIDTITESNTYLVWLRMNDRGDIVSTRILEGDIASATLWRHP